MNAKFVLQVTPADTRKLGRVSYSTPTSIKVIYWHIITYPTAIEKQFTQTEVSKISKKIITLQILYFDFEYVKNSGMAHSNLDTNRAYDDARVLPVIHIGFSTT